MEYVCNLFWVIQLSKDQQPIFSQRSGGTCCMWVGISDWTAKPKANLFFHWRFDLLPFIDCWLNKTYSGSFHHRSPSELSVVKLRRKQTMERERRWDARWIYASFYRTCSGCGRQRSRCTSWHELNFYDIFYSGMFGLLSEPFRTVAHTQCLYGVGGWVDDKGREP